MKMMREDHSPSPRRTIAVLALALLAWLAAIHPLRAQAVGQMSDRDEERIERQLEKEEIDGTGDVDEEVERSIDMPLDLRTATASDLARLPGISIRDAGAIVAFIARAAPADRSRLDSIPGLTAEQLLTLRIYTTLHAEPPERSRLNGEVRIRAATDLQRRRGYRDELTRVVPRRSGPAGDSTGLDTIGIGSSYLGARPAILMRARVSYGTFSAGCTIEKDRGEPILWRDTLDYSYQRNEYVDRASPARRTQIRFGGFVSAFAQEELAPATIILGDYTARFGEGLLFGAFNNRSGAGEIARGARGAARAIRPYRSTDEAHFLRGVAITLHEGRWLPRGLALTAFASARSLDASIGDGMGDNGSEVVESLRDDGLHRTRAEMRSSGNLTERLLGVNLQHRFHAGSAAITIYHARYSLSIADARAVPYDRVTMASIDGHYNAPWGTLFGEAARDANGTVAAIGGIAAKLGAAEIVLKGRWLPASFITPHGSASPLSSTGVRNEHGIDMGVRARLIDRLHLIAYADLQDAPDRSSSLPFPPMGEDGFLQLEYQPTKELEIDGRIRRTSSRDLVTLADTLGRERRLVLDRTSSGGRIAMRYIAGPLELRAELERRFVDLEMGAPARHGLLTYVDLELHASGSLEIGIRFGLFDVDDFDATIYELEEDLPGRLTSIPLSGHGRRSLLTARWRPSRGIAIAAKYAGTVYDDRNTISPGTLDEIDGPINNTLAIQLDARF
jgi:hypothetical protein